MREYELWLDESGDFEQESQVTEHPSLVGGILIEKGQLTEREITELVGAEKNEGIAHATTMDKQGVKEIVLPALEMICHRSGKLVYFENQEQLHTYSNRDLYLRVLAAGIVQLMQYLGKDGSFFIDVTIAVRYVPEAKRLNKIEEEDYAATLRRYMQEQWQSGTFDIDARTRMNLTVLSARRERRLQLADYACNARFTRHKKKKFSAEMRQRLENLFDADFIYSVQVKTPRNYILSHLAIGDVAEALMEFYTAREQGKVRSMEEDIFGRLKEMGYRLARLQINQFVSNLVGMMRRETDFERGEATLRKVLGDFFPKLEKFGISVQTDEGLFRLYWCLSDMYLREGDVLHAEEVLSKMKSLLESMNYRVENLRFLYLYLDRRGLLEINCMEYEKAVETMTQAIHCMEDVRSVLECDALIQGFFGKSEISSEWLGNAYCMKIYAEMFLQRFHPEMYPAIREDTETALKQYAYSGELERNQQYRAHIEMEAGNYRKALEWLFRTQELNLSDDLMENCVSYLDGALKEDILSRTYYLMYYVEIMDAAQRNGMPELAGTMLRSLVIQKEIMDELLYEEGLDTDLRSDTHRPPKIFKNFLWETIDTRPIDYHPLEIVRWKYGSYLAAAGNLKRAETFWKQAIHICNAIPDYTVMKMVRIAVQMEWLSALLFNDASSEANKLQRKLTGGIGGLLREGALPPKMREYVMSCQQILLRIEKEDLPLKSKAGLCYEASRKIAF